MRKLLPMVFLTMTILLLAACQASPAVTTSQPENIQAMATSKPENLQAAPAAIQAPENGKSTLVGKVVSKGNGEPVPNVPVRLAEVYLEGGEGAYVLDGAFSPGDVTDENGDFLIENVDLKGYVIIVGDIMDKYEVIVKEDGKPRVWSFPADEIYQVPTLEVDLKSP